MSKKSLFFSVVTTLTLAGGIAAAAPQLNPGVDFSLQDSQEIAINNRILLKVNGKSISVLDVVKKMDLHFFRQYPELASSPMARYQFYLASWRVVLRTVIDDQLIIADADEKKVEITEGDVREELEDLFGPDVVLNIDKIGLTYDEAWDLLKQELKVRRMNAMMVRSKALNDVSPKAIRELFEEHLKTHPGDDSWEYRMLSIRGKNQELVTQLANEAYQQLTEEELPLEEVMNKLTQSGGESIQISLSEEYERKGAELSAAHKGILQTLTAGGISAPTVQGGKNNKESIARLFFLKSRKDGVPPTFDEMKNQLQSQLTQKAIAHHSKIYLEKLRIYYGITDTYVSQMIPEQFEPFALR